MTRRERLEQDIATLRESIRQNNRDRGLASANEVDEDNRWCAEALSELLREVKLESRPMPPGIHWLVMLVFVVLASVFQVLNMDSSPSRRLHLVIPGGILNILLVVWVIVQCRFIRKIDSDSKAIWLFLLSIGSAYFAGAISSFLPGYSMTIGFFGNLVSAVLYICAAFSARSSMVRHYNSIEPIKLDLGAGLTLFFGFLYLQYHFWRIARWKKTGVLGPAETRFVD
jgi:hypothetical protein